MTAAELDHDPAPIADDDERELIWQDGYTTGRLAGLAARPPATVWVPVPLTWRHVRPGDVFVGNEGTLWYAQNVEPLPGGLAHVRATGPAGIVEDAVHPDEPITVLYPAPERDAIDLAVDVLGARLIETRTT